MAYRSGSKFLLSVSACLLLSSGAVVKAAEYTVQFTGTLDSVTGNPFVGVTPAVGDALTGSFSYDSATPDGNPGDPNIGAYSQDGVATAFQFTVDGKTVNSIGGFQFNKLDDYGGFDYVQVFDNDVIQVDGSSSGAGADMEILLTCNSTAVFNSDALPLVLNFAQLNYAHGEFYTNSFQNLILFSITSLTVVPEPSTFALGALAGFSMWCFRCRRR